MINYKTCWGSNYFVGYIMKIFPPVNTSLIITCVFEIIIIIIKGYTLVLWVYIQAIDLGWLFSNPFGLGLGKASSVWRNWNRILTRGMIFKQKKKINK